jgi:hypothetical protein
MVSELCYEVTFLYQKRMKIALSSDLLNTAFASKNKPIHIYRLSNQEREPGKMSRPGHR